MREVACSVYLTEDMMRIAEIRIRFSVPESVAAEMPQQELDKLTRQLDFIVDRIVDYARNHTPSSITLEIG